ncbi:hypothetical protein OCS_03942 [Ophiocordyceps sinensis CO18]|uniref:Uncharacterized protein n=1 Tax=Ophiocordyceps sinensis (strain Co18 / CGMCC 3.14243) TaxID=911162 RepID=T5AET0_OPHSC|nr:hypothetical protein OCS_03942 [Ophiocordyceps sinensis CO18]
MALRQSYERRDEKSFTISSHLRRGRHNALKSIPARSSDSSDPVRPRRVLPGNPSVPSSRRRYTNNRGRGRRFSRGGGQGYRSSRGGSSNFGNRQWSKKCFVCQKEGCWSTRHTPEERARSKAQYHAQCLLTGNPSTFEAYLTDYEGDETPRAAIEWHAQGGPPRRLGGLQVRPSGVPEGTGGAYPSRYRGLHDRGPAQEVSQGVCQGGRRDGAPVETGVQVLGRRCGRRAPDASPASAPFSAPNQPSSTFGIRGFHHNFTDIPASTMTDLTSKTVLNGPADWDRWISTIQKYALA